MRPWTMVALGTAVIALGFPPLVPVALLFGFVAYKKSTDRRGRIIANAAVGIALLAGVGWTVLVLVGRSRVADRKGGAECAAQLQSVLLAQERFRAARNRFADEAELGLALSAAKAVVFQLATGPNAAELKAMNVGRTGTCPDCRVVLACRTDDGWWTISSADRLVGGRTAVSGVPFQH